MKRKIDVIVVKRQSQDTITCELQEVEDSIETYYEIIGCRSIDIVGRYFNNKHFDIVLDDEGLLKANTTGELPTSWWQREGYTPNHEGLFGTLILCHSNEEGDLTSVNPLELLDLQRVYQVINTKKGDIALLFHDVEERTL